MSGVWHEGQWYPHTGYQCRRCSHMVFPTDLKDQGYEYQCFFCDEDMFGFEVEPEKKLPRVMVARPMDGVVLNTALEYLLDDAGAVRVFDNQLRAEAYLQEQGVPYDEMFFWHFILCDGLPPEDGEAVE